MDHPVRQFKPSIKRLSSRRSIHAKAHRDRRGIDWISLYIHVEHKDVRYNRHTPAVRGGIRGDVYHAVRLHHSPPYPDLLVHKLLGAIPHGSHIRQYELSALYNLHHPCSDHFYHTGPYHLHHPCSDHFYHTGPYHLHHPCSDHFYHACPHHHPHPDHVRRGVLQAGGPPHSMRLHEQRGGLQREKTGRPKLSGGHGERHGGHCTGNHGRSHAHVSPPDGRMDLPGDRSDIPSRRHQCRYRVLGDRLQRGDLLAGLLHLPGQLRSNTRESARDQSRCIRTTALCIHQEQHDPRGKECGQDTVIHDHVL